MNKKLFSLTTTLLLALLFASCGKASGNNAAQQTDSYAEKISFDAEEICETATLDEGVVIGGVRWATRNVDRPGTFAETPESLGMLFQWNRPYGWRSAPHYTDESFWWGYSPTQRWSPAIRGWENASWDNSMPTGTKWYAENDPCPEGWRVPTKEELIYLRDIENEWTTQNGVNGRLFGVAPNQIFLPTAGGRCNVGVHSRIGFGFYHSSTPTQRWEVDLVLQSLSFNNRNAWWFYSSIKDGHSVRCVSK